MNKLYVEELMKIGELFFSKKPSDDDMIRALEYSQRDCPSKHSESDHVTADVRKYGHEIKLPPEIPNVYSAQNTVKCTHMQGGSDIFRVDHIKCEICDIQAKTPE